MGNERLVINKSVSKRPWSIMGYMDNESAECVSTAYMSLGNR